MLNCGAREDSWESLGQLGDQTSQTKRKSTLNIHWKDWCWSWSSPRDGEAWWAAIYGVSQSQTQLKWLSCSSSIPSIRVFPNESALHIKWPKHWSFSIILPMSILGWCPLGFNLPAVQGNLKSLLQHHNLKASFLQHSAFFMVELSHLPMATGKTITLIRQTFVGKVMSLLFNIPSRFVIAFLPRSNHLWAAVTFHCFPIYLPWSDGIGCHDPRFLNVELFVCFIDSNATAKSLQSCLTLSDPMDCSLPGSSVHGIFQSRVLEWGAIAFSNRYARYSIIKHSNFYESLEIFTFTKESLGISLVEQWIMLNYNSSLRL